MISHRLLWAGVLVGSACGLAAFLQPGGLQYSLAAPVPAPAEEPEPQDPVPQRGDLMYAAGYSRDGKLLALAQAKSHDGTGEHTVLLYDARTWKHVRTLTGPTTHCFGVAFAADGNTLFAACSDGIVYSWDTKSGTSGQKLDAKAGRCDSIILSPDGKLLATGHLVLDKEPKRTEIHLWDAATGKPLRTIASDSALLWSSLTFTPDGKALAGCYNNPLTGPKDFSGVIEWDLATGTERKRYDAVRITPGALPITHSIEFTRDGKWVLVGGGEAVPDPRFPNAKNLYAYLWLFDRATGKLEKTLVERRHDYVRRLVLSPDGSRLFVPTYSVTQLVMENGQLQERSTGELQCWDTTTWESKWAKETDPTFLALIASPDGKRIGASTASGFHLLDAKTGEAKGSLIDARKK
jgi:WD40 repeat protein